MLERFKGRPLPAWFRDAKLGIFVHWGPYSVPAWAPVGRDLFALADEEGWEEALRRTPYAEWYWNSLCLPGSQVAAYHAENHPGRSYEDFAAEFRAASLALDADGWARLFAAAGARYCVLTTKHHDGFTLWPSQRPSPHRPAWSAARDLVGDVATSCRAAGLRFGTYYSGGLDWTFGGAGARTLSEVFSSVPRSPEYLAHVTAHWQELIERYEPSVLWNDIAHPGDVDDAHGLFARFYERVPDGVVNNRFDLVAHANGLIHADFVTPEYQELPSISPVPFEVCRGIGTSFGWNRAETARDLLSVEQLVHLLVDVVSKGGNLLLDVGPTARGSIPSLQRERLEGLGAWLARNGEAIYASSPWVMAQAALADGTPVRFTAKEGAVYVHVLGPVGPIARLPGFGLPRGTDVRLVGGAEPLQWNDDGGDLVVALPGPSREPVTVLRVFPAPAVQPHPA